MKVKGVSLTEREREREREKEREDVVVLARACTYMGYSIFFRGDVSVGWTHHIICKGRGRPLMISARLRESRVCASR